MAVFPTLIKQHQVCRPFLSLVLLLTFQFLIEITANDDLEEQMRQMQTLEHCRFLFQSPSSSTIFKNEKGVHLFVTAAGRFASPSLNDPNDPSQLILQPSRLCEFAFISSSDEKVDITFTDFDFPGHPPQCRRAYLDIVFQSEATEFKNFVELNHENRYCGKDLINAPHRLISLHQSIFLLMDTTGMKNNSEGYRGFREPYHIGAPLPQSASGSTLASPSMLSCQGQLIRSAETPSGVILSPNYPGMYGDDTYCFWRLVGESGERIRLNFNDLGLFYGDEQCPFDFVNVYDGYNGWSPLLRTLCGQFRDGDVTLFSRSNEMFIEFVSGRGRYDSKNYASLPFWMPKDDFSNKRRGFKATFHFSAEIVPLNNVLGTNSAHIAGTVCDQLIQNSFGRRKMISPTASSSNSNDNDDASYEVSPVSSTTYSIYSPYYPVDSPENISCTYYFAGRNERDYIEKVRLLIADFGDGNGEAILNDNVIVNPENCIDQAHYQNLTNDIDTTFTVTFQSAGLSPLSSIRAPHRSSCPRSPVGNTRTSLAPGAIFESLGSNLTVTFNSISTILAGRKRRFLMHYSFVRDFHVAGVGKQLADDSCHFVFNSSFLTMSQQSKQPNVVDANFISQHSKQQISFFTSPHFPRPYPSGITCVYDLIIDSQKYNQLRIWFELFDVGEPSPLMQQSERNVKCPDSDHVSVYQLLPSSSTEGNSNNNKPATSFSPLYTSVLHSVLCGRYLPGPLVSDPEAAGFQIVFTSKSKRSSSSWLADSRGFRANLEFLVRGNSGRSDQLKTVNDSTNYNNIIDCPFKQIVVGRKGVVISPSFPSFYSAHGLSCDWTIQALDTRARLQLMLSEFEVEGTYNPTASVENCQHAALELYTSGNLDQPTAIRCSSASALSGEIFLSQGNKVRIRFLTSPASTGGPGFRIDWNEFFDLNETECRMSGNAKLWCPIVRRCISTELRCDGIPQCGGLLDVTDEENCSRPPIYPQSLVLIAAGGSAALLSFVVILLVVVCRLRIRRDNNTHDPMHGKQIIGQNIFNFQAQRLQYKEGGNIPAYINKKHRQASAAETGLLQKSQRLDHENQRNRNYRAKQFQKNMEETTILDAAETISGSTAVTSTGSLKKTQLFEKITIV